jgi:hypothetical protein
MSVIGRTSYQSRRIAPELKTDIMHATRGYHEQDLACAVGFCIGRLR